MKHCRSWTSVEENSQLSADSLERTNNSKNGIDWNEANQSKTQLTYEVKSEDSDKISSCSSQKICDLNITDQIRKIEKNFNTNKEELVTFRSPGKNLASNLISPRFGFKKKSPE